MASYLVSFIDAGGQYGSHVVDLPEAPSAAQAALDLQVNLAMEYGTDRAMVMNWDLLPDGSTHPGGEEPYCYFISYTFITAIGLGFGSTTFLRTSPICTLADLRDVEEWFRSEQQARVFHLVSCKALKEPSTELLQDYAEFQQLQDSE